jgi:hypothetical protein
MIPAGWLAIAFALGALLGGIAAWRDGVAEGQRRTLDRMARRRRSERQARS